MTKFNKGAKHTTNLSPKPPVKRSIMGLTQTAITRVGKQSKFGAHKGKATPGSHANNTRNLGGR